ncbi:MAG: hypothetical protein WAO76_00990 [Georgfuchsia sp.]
MKMLLVILMSFFVVGCASVTGSKMQSVSVQTIQSNNNEVTGAVCTLTNDEGKWFVTTPGSVTLQKSTADLAIECKKDGEGKGNETAVSRANGAIWGNILLGGGIGYIVDRNNGAGFDYPTSVTVVLNKIEQVFGIEPIAENQAKETQVATVSDKPDNSNAIK